MPAPRQPFPSALQGAAFTVAQGRSIGLGQTRMRASDVERPFRGVRVGPSPEIVGQDAPQVMPGGGSAVPDGGRQAKPDLGLADRCRALMLAVPPTAFFSHLTAARLWPLPLPQAFTAEPIHVSVRAPARPPRRAGVAGHLVKDPLAGVVPRGGLRLVDPATLFCELTTQLSLENLVAVGDALVLRPVYQDQWDDRPWVSLPQLKERVELFRGRGKRVATCAADLIRPGAESRPETLLRLALMDAGLPEPEVNMDLHDALGRFLGRADLVYRAWRVIVEYDGDQHRTSTKQFDHDVLRLEGFARAGWVVVRIVGRSFFADRPACLARVRHALIEAGWRA